MGRLLAPLGSAWQVEEKLLDAVTGLAGSGPAFVYVMIEALSDAGVRMGLPRAMAAAMAAQTVRGAAEMVLATGEHPGRVEGPRGQPRRHDHRRLAGVGVRRRSRRADGRRRGRHAAVDELGKADDWLMS